MDDFIRRMQQQDEMIRRLAEGPFADIRRQEEALARAVDPSRSIDLNALEKTARLLSGPEFASRLAEAVERTNAILERMRSPEFVTALERAANEATERQRQMDQFINRLAFAMPSIEDQIGRMARQFESTMLALSTIEFDGLGGLIEASDRQRLRLSAATENLVLDHNRLVRTVAPSGTPSSVLPPALAELPTQDLFVHTTAVRIVTPHRPLAPEQESRALVLRAAVLEETGAYLEVTLADLSPPFLEQYRGTKARLVDRGSDWWTQGSASMRKLLKGVLHTAAPNELVLPWAQKYNKELDRVGRPTRATKIEWLCEPIGSDEYRAYLRSELNSALALIDLIDTAQHVDEFPDFEQQYEWVMVRVEFAIKHILVLWRLRQTK